MSGPIPATELTDMRAWVATSFDNSCVIQRKGTTRTAEGYPVDNYATIATVNCNITEPTPTMMQNYADIIGPNESWLIRMPQGQNILRDDQVITGGITMRVQVILKPSSYDLSMRVLAAKVV